MAKHLAICINTAAGRVGFVITAETHAACVEMAERHDNRVGYSGEATFAEAVEMAVDLQNGSPRAIAKYRATLTK